MRTLAGLILGILFLITAFAIVIIKVIVTVAIWVIAIGAVILVLH